jgi:prolyl-tRNA editing enzyme YbaK/EbsC (Cys-tRNA(Pro) deacylase)
MHKLIILVEPQEDGETFDVNWPDFLHLSEKMPGLIRESTSREIKRLFGTYHPVLIHELFFDSLQALQEAMVCPDGIAAGQLLQKMTGGHFSLLVVDSKEDTIENIRKHQASLNTSQENELGPDNLADYLDEHKISGEILQLEVPTPTVEAAARATSSLPEQIVKSILFLVDGQPCLTIACGENTISTRALADYFGVGRKRVKLADPKTVLELTGYSVGAMPPFGHKSTLFTLIDWHVLEQPEVFAGGGSDSALLHLPSRTIQEVTQGVVLDLTSEKSIDQTNQHTIDRGT